jgi:hypothetical protein
MQSLQPGDRVVVITKARVKFSFCYVALVPLTNRFSSPVGRTTFEVSSRKSYTRYLDRNYSLFHVLLSEDALRTSLVAFLSTEVENNLRCEPRPLQVDCMVRDFIRSLENNDCHSSQCRYNTILLILAGFECDSCTHKRLEQHAGSIL